uniref:Uncharacterized protein n=1 Tax=Anguilla anguilla TaxID=7936 RepID=A0A0E9VLE5_ANGAN
MNKSPDPMGVSLRKHTGHIYSEKQQRNPKIVLYFSDYMYF